MITPISRQFHEFFQDPRELFHELFQLFHDNSYHPRILVFTKYIWLQTQKKWTFIHTVTDIFFLNEMEKLLHEML